MCSSGDAGRFGGECGLGAAVLVAGIAISEIVENLKSKSGTLWSKKI
jgi:hypothetical protein